MKIIGEVMLDLNHPQSEYIFAAARAEDSVLEVAKRMSVAARKDWVRLRDGCATAFAELRRLARDEFAEVSAIPLAIDALEQAVGKLAMLPNVPEEGTPVDSECPACGARLGRRRKYWFSAPVNSTDIYCCRCVDIIMPSLSVLSSSENGFGTDAI